MIFIPDPYYFSKKANTNGKAVPLEKAILVTAKTIAQWCIRFEAEVILPKEGTKKQSRVGKIPTDPVERDKCIEDACAWLLENSLTPDLFSLFLYASNDIHLEDVAAFDHHDDTCCWALNITEEQFHSLQEAWEKASLPKDLFYDRSKMMQETLPSGLIGRLLNLMGFSSENIRSYSPKEWEERMQTKKN